MSEFGRLRSRLEETVAVAVETPEESDTKASTDTSLEAQLVERDKYIHDLEHQIAAPTEQIKSLQESSDASSDTSEQTVADGHEGGQGTGDEVASSDELGGLDELDALGELDQLDQLDSELDALEEISVTGRSKSKFELTPLFQITVALAGASSTPSKVAPCYWLSPPLRTLGVL